MNDICCIGSSFACGFAAGFALASAVGKRPPPGRERGAALPRETMQEALDITEVAEVARETADPAERTLALLGFSSPWECCCRLRSVN